MDLAGKADEAESASFVPPAQDCFPCTGRPAWGGRHCLGTHAAGMIPTNNIGTALRRHAFQVLNLQGAGMFSWLIQGVMHAAQSGNEVVTMSLGAYFPKNSDGPGPLGTALNKAVNYANSTSTLPVSAAAALEKDRRGASVPCQSGAGVCVGATTNLDVPANCRNHGLSRPQITPAGHFFLLAAGTSMGAPDVAGAAALADSAALGGPVRLLGLLLLGGRLGHGRSRRLVAFREDTRGRRAALEEPA